MGGGMTKKCVITEVRVDSDGDDIRFVTSARTVILAFRGGEW